MPTVTYGGFVNLASDRALLFCDTEQREEQTPLTPFSFAKTALLDIRLIVIPCHMLESHGFHCPWSRTH